VLRRPVPERRSALSLVKRFDVRPSELVDRPLSTLSGGNQQKVVCGRALRNGPALLVVDDPTAGVDVHSRAQLHSIIRETTQAGTTVVFASTDFEEVASEADRALVLWNGRIHAVLRGDELTPERIAQACYGTYERSEENPSDDR
jgi:ribose transport system ATP-binding protein